jgi:hypothetical protein
VAEARLTSDDTNLLIATTGGDLLVYTDPAVSVKLVHSMLAVGWTEGGFGAFG